MGATGTPPIGYQWFFNGVAVQGATGPSLKITNIQVGNAGSYSVVVENANGTATSSNAMLVVVPSEPVFTSHPARNFRLLGDSVTFSAASIGTSPIASQWLFNGQPIPGATQPTLTLTNLDYSHAGNYALRAANSVGTAVSSNAVLVVYSVGELGAALNNSAIVWSTTNIPWFPQTNITHDGIAAAQGGPISDDQRSTLQTVATGPATVTYWWKVNCHSFWSLLAFTVNGTVLNSIAGNVEWQKATNYLGTGTHLLEWDLRPKYTTFARGTAWVDQVEITLGGTAAAITSQPASSTKSAGTSATLSVSATGTPPLRYQWQFNGSDLPGATNASLVFANIQQIHAGSYAVVVTNDYGYAKSSNATLTVSASAPVIISQPATRTAIANTSLTLSIFAWGSEPLFYQWYFNGAPLAAENTSTLHFASVQSSNSGFYSAIVSNSLGFASTTNAYLDVAPVMVQELWADSRLFRTPTRLGDLVAVAAGVRHTIALRPDGTVIAWGENAYGQTNVPPDLSDVIAIAAGHNHSLALKADGTVTAWGDWTYGQTNVPAGLSNVVAIAAGPYHSLALTSDGTVAGWGNNLYGQIDIPAALTNAQSIAAGYYNSFAVRADGSVAQWGNGPAWWHNGETKVLEVAPGLSDIRSIAAGGFSGWSLQNDGTARAWGWDEGTGPFTNVYYPPNGGSMSSWTGVVREQTRYSNIMIFAASAGASPANDYALCLRQNGTLISSPASWMGRFPTPTPVNVVGLAAVTNRAVLLINDGSPRVVQNPLDRVAYSGDNVTFLSGIVAPGGDYQWQFNGADLDGATNFFLTITNVPLSAGDLYRGRAANTLGTATNRAARLTVLRSAPCLNPGSLVFDSGAFRWRVDRLSGQGTLVIFASSNLIDWIPIRTNAPQAGSLPLIDVTATNYPVRFYRAVEQ